MWSRSASIYSPGDATVPRQPSRDYVPSPWVEQAVQTARSSALAVTAAIAIGVIFLLGRRK
jgi:hypothetical protein